MGTNHICDSQMTQMSETFYAQNTQLLNSSNLNDSVFKQPKSCLLMRGDNESTQQIDIHEQQTQIVEYYENGT